MNSQAAAIGDARPGVGRPTKAQQAIRNEELLNVALDIFLERGFDQATVDDIVNTVGMSKRTVYARYKDKAALFQAAVRRAIEHYTLSRSALEAVVDDDLETTLTRIAHLRIANVATPIATKLQRILTTESYRFPELINAAFKEGAGPAIDVLCDVFARHTAHGEIAVDEPAHAATAFLSLVVGGPARMIVTGNQLSEKEMSARVRFAVGLFLNGVRVR